MTRVAILRPEPGASATLARARELGLDALAMPLFATEPVDWRAPDPGSFDGVLLTSANGARLAGDQLRAFTHLPAYAVGQATAREAEQQGFEIAKIGSGGAAELLATIDPGLRLLHLAGEDRIDAPVANGQTVTSVTVYRSRAIEPIEDIERLKGNVALVHSPRAAVRLGKLIDGSTLSRGDIAVAAISPAAAAAAGPGWARIATAERPTDDALLALAAELCKMMREP